MEQKIKAIVLKSVDYQENDKLLLLYSGELGKFTAIIKGVKKPNAQLKYASEQFCFGEYQFAQKNSHYVVIGCNCIESFYCLRNDIEKYYSACVLLDTIATLEQEESNPQLFVLLLKYLQKLVESQASPKLLALKFILTYLASQGYGMQFDRCSLCKTTSFEKLYLDLEAGGITCMACRSNSALALPATTLSCLRLTADMPLDSISNLKFKPSYINDCLLTLYQYISHSLFKIKSLQELLTI
ncbi:MAG: DNA repair protein RecO [Clostridia bacterium]